MFIWIIDSSPLRKLTVQLNGQATSFGANYFLCLHVVIDR